MDKKNIKNKINALLAKTTENGATESEAISALSKAKVLMMEYFISENDLHSPFAFEKCVLKDVPRVKLAYNLTGFLFRLSQLFDCEHFFTKETVTFFGYEQDVELCAYFYTFIIRACLNEKEKYTKSEDFKVLKIGFHGRTLVASFITGFIYGINRKMQSMYEERQKDSPQEVGLMILDKKSRVDQQYKDQNIKTRLVNNAGVIHEIWAFNNGIQQAEKTQLSQGIGVEKEETKSICCHV